MRGDMESQPTLDGRQIQTDFHLQGKLSNEIKYDKLMQKMIILVTQLSQLMLI